MKTTEHGKILDGYIAIQVSERSFMDCPHCFHSYVNVRVIQRPDPLDENQSKHIIELFHYTYCPMCKGTILSESDLEKHLAEIEQNQENPDLEEL